MSDDSQNCRISSLFEQIMCKKTATRRLYFLCSAAQHTAFDRDKDPRHRHVPKLCSESPFQINDLAVFPYSVLTGGGPG